MSPELTPASSVRQGMIVPLLVWLPLAMIVVFLTQSIFVMLATYFLLASLFAAKAAPPMKRRLGALLSGSFNGEEWLSHVRESCAHIAIVALIFPIFLTLSSGAQNLSFDEQYLVSEASTFTESIVLAVFNVFSFLLAGLFAYFCVCLKPEGRTATPRQLLFLAYLIAAVFILLSGEEWVFERMRLLSLNISGKEFLDPASDTLHVALLSIVVLVAIYCYYKISIVLFEHLVTKDKKLQLRRWMLLALHKRLLKNKSVTKDKLFALKFALKFVGVMVGGVIMLIVIFGTIYLLEVAA